MEFRLDFFFQIVMDLVFYAVNIAFFRVLYLHAPSLGGWSEPQTMVFVGMYLVVDAINMAVFSGNMWFFPMLVNRGDLDYYLVRPVSTLFFLSFRNFSVNSVVNLLFAAGILLWALRRLPDGLTVAQVLMVVPLLLFGALMHYLIQLAFTLPVFWTHSENGFRQVFHNLVRVSERPDRIFTGWARRIFVSVIPFCLITSLPARLLVEPWDGRVFLEMLMVFCGFWFLILWIWNRALRSYSSASS